MARIYSHFVASYDSQGHGGGIRPRLHTGLQGDLENVAGKRAVKALKQFYLITSRSLYHRRLQCDLSIPTKYLYEGRIYNCCGPEAIKIWWPLSVTTDLEFENYFIFFYFLK
jgi:hypothetical protein